MNEPQQEQELWKRLPMYLIENYEGEQLTEELIQEATAKLCTELGITPASTPADAPTDATGQAGGLAWKPISSAPKGGRHSRILVTNNFAARDASGNMSHIWLVRMVHEQDGRYCAFEDGAMQQIRDLTHWANIPTPDQIDLELERDAAVAALASIKDLILASDDFSSDEVIKIIETRIGRYSQSIEWFASKALQEEIAEARSTIATLRAECARLREDKVRLDWLEAQTKKSPTGISFDWVPSCEGDPSGYRFMRRFFIGSPAHKIREAIDFARNRQWKTPPLAQRMANDSSSLYAQLGGDCLHGWSTSRRNRRRHCR